MQEHKNNIGFLRLVFASLVIIGHAPEMTDGDRHREPLTLLFGTVSLGTLSVDAFFLLSGFLIAMSMAKSGSLSNYLERRVLRIYPAFVVSYLLSVFLLGPIVGAELWHSLPATFARLAVLREPMRYPGQLPGLHYPLLNGSMWTISYEFRCYLLVALLGVAGLLGRTRIIVCLTAVALLASVAVTFAQVQGMIDGFALSHRAIEWIFGVPSRALRLTSVFLVGVSLYVCRDGALRLLNPATAFVSAAVCAVLLLNAHTADVAVATLGAVPLFWIALKADIGPLQRINDKWDISYGTYLYGWPVATFLLWMQPTISPWLLAAMTLPISFALGAASWFGLEKRVKDLRRSHSTAVAASP